ncbi:MAG: helix-turn-helix transcriptional regulator [Pirellulaceae bacterium]|nr:helix-turn-helix transcriptional regulator [Pirellulaceae bacterium]
MVSPEKIQKQFGARLRSLRLERGISQETLAFDAGLDRTYVNSVEQGKRNISLVNIVKLAVALKIELSDLTDFPIGKR